MIKFLTLISIILISCSDQVDIVQEKKAISLILQKERKAHFDKDIDAFISTFADSVISVYDGAVTMTTPEDNKARFGPYFKSVEFIKWDDTIEPIINISDDGSMAFATVKKTIVLTYPDTMGNPLIDSANYAWVSIYKKFNNEWKVVCNASTYEP